MSTSIAIMAVIVLYLILVIFTGVMIGRKTKRPKKDEGEENGLFQSDTLLEYQNKSLCTLVNDLREKLKAKEESYDKLSTKFNSTISFLNIFTTTINSLNNRCFQHSKMTEEP